MSASSPLLARFSRVAPCCDRVPTLIRHRSSIVIQALPLSHFFFEDYLPRTGALLERPPQAFLPKRHFELPEQNGPLSPPSTPILGFTDAPPPVFQALSTGTDQKEVWYAADWRETFRAGLTPPGIASFPLSQPLQVSGRARCCDI